MIKDVATIEFIEKLGELAKNFGALLVRYSQRLQEHELQEMSTRFYADKAKAEEREKAEPAQLTK